MKKYFVLLFTICASLVAGAQTKGLKIAYIDMEFILDKVPDFAEAKSQLEQRAAKWKTELDAKRNEITKLKESLQAEKALLTKELIEEREEEIMQLEKDLSEYQEKKFGPKGELITQKSVLVKPIQDQVFTIVQEISATRKYDFVFDKSSDLTILFAAKKYDISELIVKRLTRTAKQQKMNSKEAKQLEEQEKEDERKSDPDVADREKAQEDKRAARQKLIDDRKAASEAKRQAAQEKKEQTIRDRQAAREAAKNGTKTTTTPATTDGTGGNDDDAPGTTDKKAATTDKKEDATKEGETKETAPAKTAEELKADREAANKAAREERERILEERKQNAAKRRQEAQEKRDAAKKAREDKQKEKQGGTEGGTTAPDPTGGEDDAAPTQGNGTN